MKSKGKEKLVIDISHGQLPKTGEELCGDTIDITRSGSRIMAVLADGLGSGVKANILSRLTAKIAATLLKKGSSLEDVIDTLASTLPVCKIRQLAYSTFTILQVDTEGQGYLAEFDNPAVMTNCSLTTNEIQIGGYKVKESRFTMKDGDWLAFCSDGVLHAGIGGIWNMGWGWEKVNNHLHLLIRQSTTAKAVVDNMVSLCQKLYQGRPGDDASIVVVRARLPRTATVMVGPPLNPADDGKVVQRLISSNGQKIVCGGTTGNLVARELGKEITVDMRSIRKDLPPVGVIEGIDLVTEGLLTLTRVLANLQEHRPGRDFFYKIDGASRLTLALLEADYVHFLVGRAVNPAHQDPNMPPILALKQQIVSDLITVLRRRGKKVNAKYY